MPVYPVWPKNSSDVVVDQRFERLYSGADLSHSLRAPRHLAGQRRHLLRTRSGDWPTTAPSPLHSDTADANPPTPCGPRVDPADLDAPTGRTAGTGPDTDCRAGQPLPRLCQEPCPPIETTFPNDGLRAQGAGTRSGRAPPWCDGDDESLPSIQGTSGTSTSRPYRLVLDSGCPGFRSRCLSDGRIAGGLPWRLISFQGSAWDSRSLGSVPRRSRCSDSSTEPLAHTAVIPAMWSRTRAGSSGAVVSRGGASVGTSGRDTVGSANRRASRSSNGSSGRRRASARVSFLSRCRWKRCAANCDFMQTGTTTGARTWRSTGKHPAMSTMVARRFGGESSRGLDGLIGRVDPRATLKRSNSR